MGMRMWGWGCEGGNGDVEVGMWGEYIEDKRMEEPTVTNTCGIVAHKVNN